MAYKALFGIGGEQKADISDNHLKDILLDHMLDDIRTVKKKIGNDVSGRSDFDWRDVDIVSVTGDYEEKIFKESFNLNKASTTIIKGNPRQSKSEAHGSPLISPPSM